jgi:environmental stress-induced protein Ves
MTRYTPGNRTTINWASGTSTEIFIYPATGNFADRDFTFRISTATVEAEESTFSFFEGITRHLMILKGELELTHEGRYTKHLQPFDQDTFSGSGPPAPKAK